MENTDIMLRGMHFIQKTREDHWQVVNMELCVSTQRFKELNLEAFWH